MSLQLAFDGLDSWLVVVCQLVKNMGFVVVDRGWWQIDGGFCHGLVVSWWLGLFDIVVGSGDGGGAARGCGLKRGRR